MTTGRKLEMDRDLVERLRKGERLDSEEAGIIAAMIDSLAVSGRLTAPHYDTAASPAAPAQSGEPVASAGVAKARKLLSALIPMADNSDSPVRNFHGTLEAIREALAAPQPSQTAVVLDDERAAFEAWGSETFNYGFHPETWDDGAGPVAREPHYEHEGTQMAWEGWQARAASPNAEISDQQILDVFYADASIDACDATTVIEFARRLLLARAASPQPAQTERVLTDAQVIAYLEPLCDKSRIEKADVLRVGLALLTAASAPQPFITFDDGSKVFIDSWTGGAHETGHFGGITLRFVAADGTAVVRGYQALDTSAGKPKTESPLITKLRREVLLSKMTHNFTFSRDEVIELLGGKFTSLDLIANLSGPVRRLEGLRELCGYVENGTDRVVSIFQDDATREWVVKVSVSKKGSYYGRTFEQALDAAIEGEKE
jgi:hypothetical protein